MFWRSVPASRSLGDGTLGHLLLLVLQGVAFVRLVLFRCHLNDILDRRRRQRLNCLIEPCGQSADGVFGARGGETRYLALSVLLHVDDCGRAFRQRSESSGSVQRVAVSSSLIREGHFDRLFHHSRVPHSCKDGRRLRPEPDRDTRDDFQDAPWGYTSGATVSFGG